MMEGAAVYGLGVGPGDPELLTLKAHRILQGAAVVAYPAPETGDSFARQIVAPHLPRGIIEMPIRMPIADGSFPKGDIYRQAAETILSHIAAGKDVAVLCEGDPLFYGSFAYLYQYLAGQCRVEVVPGVSSIMAATAEIGQSLALRHESATIIPATAGIDALRTAFVMPGGVAIIKVGARLPLIRAALAEAGREAAAIIISHATLPQQKMMKLSDWKDDVAPYFSIILSPPVRS